MLLNNAWFRIRRELLVYKVNGDSALLILNGISLKRVNALLAPNCRYKQGFVNILLVVHLHGMPSKTKLMFVHHEPL